MTPIEAYSAWFIRFWGPNPPSGDGASTLALDLGSPYVARGIVASVKVPSARAQSLADAMVDFRQPGLPGLGYAEYWLGALIDAAGIDPDAEWLVALDKRVIARDWVGALAMVKARPGAEATGSSDGAALAAARNDGRSEVKAAVASAIARF